MAVLVPFLYCKNSLIIFFIFNQKKTLFLKKYENRVGMCASEVHVKAQKCRNGNILFILTGIKNKQKKKNSHCLLSDFHNCHALLCLEMILVDFSSCY